MKYIQEKLAKDRFGNLATASQDIWKDATMEKVKKIAKIKANGDILV